MNDLISIIVPIYNVELYLEKCISSILVQTYTNLEIILIDDGSTDRSSEICDLYASIDNRVVVVHKINGGVSTARNTGLEISKGEYISFIDGDDNVTSDFIQTLYDIMMSSEGEISICNCQFVDERYKILHNRDECYVISDEIKSGMELLDSYMYEKNNGLYTVVWNKLYKRSLFQNLKFPDGKLHEDEFVSYKLISKAHRIACTSKRLYFYVQRKDSATSLALKRSKIDKKEAFFEKADYFHDLKEYRYEAEVLIDICFLMSQIPYKEKKEYILIKKRYRKTVIKFITRRNIMLTWRLKYILNYISPLLYFKIKERLYN